MRGEWDEMKQQKKVCPKCAEAAWHYPETVESFNYRVLPEEAERSLCEEGSRSFVLEGLLRARAGGGPQTQERLRWTVAPLMRARLLDFTAESAAAQGEAVIRRAISLGDYGACLRFLPDGGRRQRVCDYITLNTWRELLHEYEATARTERTVGLRSTASAVERFRNKLSRYLLSELRRYHRHPELQRPGPPT